MGETRGQVTPVSVVIANCKRLIADAELLHRNGRHGSALSLAILAFEEAGKGLREEMDWTKTKRTPSWHQFRQIVAGFALQIAVLRKYQIGQFEIPDKVKAEIQSRHDKAKTMSELFRTPLADEFRNAVAEASRPVLEHLSQDQAAIAEIELRYIRLILEAAARGDVEETRQRGMYVDIAHGKVTSDPGAVEVHEVFRWIFVAERAVSLLETGDSVTPFSPLAARLESIVGQLPATDARVSEIYEGIAAKMSNGDDFFEAYLSILPEEEIRDMKDMLPILKPLVLARLDSQ